MEQSGRLFLLFLFVHRYTKYIVRAPPDLEVREEGTRRQQLHIILRVTIALVSVDHIRDLSDSLDILRGDLNFPPQRFDLVTHPPRWAVGFGPVVVKLIHEGGASNIFPSKQTPSELEDAGRLSILR